MDRLELRPPDEKDLEIVMSYRKEFLENDDSMDGTAGLVKYDVYEEWLQGVRANSNEDTVREGLVPATTLLAISKESKKLIGMIDIRHRLNDHLEKFGGHIGYSVRKSERLKGYATEMLALALEKCKKMDMDRVLITCDINNIGSEKTILNNGGVFKNQIREEDSVTKRFWINISE